MPAALDDPTQPPHYRPDAVHPSLEPYTVLLKDRETTATIYPIYSPDQLPLGLLAFLCDELNMEIERGDTLPLFDTLHIDTFQNYWFGSFAGVMLIGDAPTIENPRQWEKECLGTFYIKPNYPGRCAHICTAGFLVNAGIRGKGIGKTLAECYLEWAPKLGYNYSVFNLVFETNVMARRIWEALNFKKIGRVKGAGILKGSEHAVDALIYGRDIGDGDDEMIGDLRFDKIRFYLETGRYPTNANRQEKSRLRSSAAHYKVRDGKLLLKDREVVAEASKQLEIATHHHSESHAGINKTTSLITEKYHWTRIKDTVAIAIRNCIECRETNRYNREPKRSASLTPKEPEHVSEHSRSEQEYVPTISGLELGMSNAADDISSVTVGSASLSTNSNHQPFNTNQNELPSINKSIQDQPNLLAPISLALGTDVDDRLLAAVAAAQQQQDNQEQNSEKNPPQNKQQKRQQNKQQNKQQNQNPNASHGSQFQPYQQLPQYQPQHFQQSYPYPQYLNQTQPQPQTQSQSQAQSPPKSSQSQTQSSSTASSSQPLSTSSQYRSFQNQSRLPSLQDQQRQHIPQLQPLHQIASTRTARDVNITPLPYSITLNQSLQRPTGPQSTTRLPSISSQHFPEPFNAQSNHFQTTQSSIDPQIGAGFDNSDGEELAIARVLINHNNSDDDKLWR